MTQHDLEKLFRAFVFNRLDYCNAVFTLKTALRQLQLIQNAARVRTKTKKREHITSVLRSLY